MKLRHPNARGGAHNGRAVRHTGVARMLAAAGAHRARPSAVADERSGVGTPTAIFIEMNTTGSGEEFAACAKQLGLAPVVLTADPVRYHLLSADGGVRFHRCDTSSAAELERCCGELSKQREIRLVTSSSDHFLKAAADLARRLGLDGPSPEAIDLCRDKARQVEALARAGVAVPPRAIAVSSVEEASRAVEVVGLPAVIKPVVGTGSIGVRLVETMEEALATLAHLLDQRTNERGQPVEPRCLVMAYVEGQEFSVEFIDGQAIGVTRKHLGPLPFFVELGHTFPAPVGAVLTRNLEAAARRALEVVGHMRGAAHVELRANADGFFIIEINPRLAGGQIPRLIRRATGFDPVRAVITSVLNGRAEISVPQALYGCLRFIVPARDGTIEQFRGLDDAAQRFGLTDIVIYRRLPTQFQRVNDFRDRIGFVIATDENPEEAERRATAAATFFANQ